MGWAVLQAAGQSLRATTRSLPTGGLKAEIWGKGWEVLIKKY